MRKIQTSDFGKAGTDSTVTTLHPLQFKSIYKEKVWGGRNLAKLLFKDIPNNRLIGESWELSGFARDMSVATTPPFQGWTLEQFIDKHAADLCGEAPCEHGFPLLYKFIDAHDKLSVQVHPNDEQARACGWGNFGKTECWYVVSAAPGAQIIVGFNKGVTPDTVIEHIKRSSLEEILNCLPISAGDVLFIPAGSVHAILGDTVLYEVQQSSDTTLRIYDWGRNDPGRKLHIDDSLEIARTDYHDQHKIVPVISTDFSGVHHHYRVACRYFVLEEYSFPTTIDCTLTIKNSFQVITMLWGTITIFYNSEGSHIAHEGDTILLPAELDRIDIQGKAGSHFLLSYVPDLPRDVITPLQRQGVSAETITALGGHAATNDLIPLLS
ncbi:MAG: hypothetical protein GF398_00710 [Chitinivibrionales bacterium]|nr:hypothetical protein [Chitinivibrionales bacterium]